MTATAVHGVLIQVSCGFKRLRAAEPSPIRLSPMKESKPAPGTGPGAADIETEDRTTRDRLSSSSEVPVSLKSSVTLPTAGGVNEYENNPACPDPEISVKFVAPIKVGVKTNAPDALLRVKKR